ncbi:MAG: class I SAM-dependent methyltransferase [Gammaproteobacteria bacterium]
MTNSTLNLDENLYNYMLSVSLRESAVLEQLRHETAKLPGSQMQIAPEQGQFMAFLIEIMGARLTLEIGTYTGYSTLWVAQALAADGRIITCDIDEKTTAIAQRFWQQAGVAHKIESRLAPALDTLNQLIKEGYQQQFDFIFIDADKANYNNYYEQALNLLRRDGVIAIDNVLWGGAVAQSEFNDNSTRAIRELNQRLLNDERVALSLIPIADGLTLLRKK